MRHGTVFIPEDRFSWAIQVEKVTDKLGKIEFESGFQAGLKACGYALSEVADAHGFEGTDDEFISLWKAKMKKSENE